jgi:ubiquinone/menaquinone biosynthesis C-methylase UbiE
MHLGFSATRKGSTVVDMARARYDAVADFYISGFDSAGDPASLALLNLLGPVAGLRVLDVACGHGRITRELARQGAEVTGVDLSAVLISRAKENEQNEPLGIRYIHADVTSQGAIGEDKFDAATCNFGLSDIDDLDAAITAVSGALRPAGCFVFSILHPCFAGGKDISVPFQPPEATTTKDTGPPGTRGPRYGARWELITECCRPTSVPSGVTDSGLTSSPNRSRGKTGTPLMMPTASRSSSWRGLSSFQPDHPQPLHMSGLDPMLREPL